MQDGFELPTRLSLSAADCTIAFTEALTRKASLSKVSNGIKKSSDLSATNQLITFVPTESKEKASRPSKVLEDMEMEWLLWDHLAELIILVQKLQAVCFEPRMFFCFFLLLISIYKLYFVCHFSICGLYFFLCYKSKASWLLDENFTVLSVLFYIIVKSGRGGIETKSIYRNFFINPVSPLCFPLCMERVHGNFRLLD